MSFNIQEEMKGYINHDFISKASSFLNENESGISKALSGIIPTVVSGFISKANSSDKEAHDVLSTVKNAYKASKGSSITSFFNDGGSMLDKGINLIQSLFGDKLNSLISSVSSFAGIKNSSSASLFGIAGSLMSNVIGKHVSDQNMNAPELSTFLYGQRSSVMSMFPSGLTGVADLLNLSRKSDKTKAHYTTSSPRRNMSWLLWLLLLALAIFLIWWFASKGCNKSTSDEDIKRSEPTVTVEKKGTVDSIGNFIYDVGSDKEIKLADGTTLMVGENSTEAKLFTMLSDATWTIDTVDKTKNWVVLDRVYFETGRSVLTAASQAQVKNLAAILKNFPNASLKLGGYTDNTGDSAVNKRVSEERAVIVARELINMGVGVHQVKEAVGYGPEFPVCPENDSPECMAQNRRVDLKVATK
ncbi:MAG: OmpA family protein [Chitinophagaceae bacterium]